MTFLLILVTVDPNHKELVILGQKTEKKVKMEISGGGYAGIACGLVLIITIAAFIFIAVQKRYIQMQFRDLNNIFYSKYIIIFSKIALNPPPVILEYLHITFTVLVKHKTAAKKMLMYQTFSFWSKT
jgi:hypothetical protein